VSSPLALIVVGLVVAGSVAVVALPFLRRPAPQGEGAAHRDLPGLALLERRDRALAALKELEFDHRTGKISDADYRALLGPLRRDAAESLQALKAAQPPVRVGDARPPERATMVGRR
jgi:hypothetical protein